MAAVRMRASQGPEFAKTRYSYETESRSFGPRTRSRKRPGRRETNCWSWLSAKKERSVFELQRIATGQIGPRAPSAHQPRATVRATARAPPSLTCARRVLATPSRAAHPRILPARAMAAGVPEGDERAFPDATEAPSRGKAVPAGGDLRARARAPGVDAQGRPTRWPWRAPGDVDRASTGPEAHVLFPPSRLHEACRKGHAEEVLWLLDRAEPRLSVDARDPGGRTPLHFAAGWGRLEIVRLLLERGAALEPRDEWGKAPVDWARQADRKDAVVALRVEAVHRGVVGGRGSAAPLSTFLEAALDKTEAEVRKDMDAFARKAYDRYEAMDRREGEGK